MTVTGPEALARAFREADGSVSIRPMTGGESLSLVYDNEKRSLRVSFADGSTPVFSVDALPTASETLKGRIYYLTTDNKLYKVDDAGTAWEEVGTGTGGGGATDALVLNEVTVAPSSETGKSKIYALDNGDGLDANSRALYHLNGVNGGTTFTDSANGHNGTVGSGAPVTSTSQYKYGPTSLYLNGSSHVNVAENASFLFSGDFTIHAKIYPTTTTDGCILSMYKGADDRFSLMRLSDGKVRLGVDSGWADSTSSPLTLNAWHDVMLTINSARTEWKVFVDGTLACQGSYSSKFSTSTNHAMNIGYSDPSWNQAKFTGYIDEIYVCEGLLQTGTFTPSRMPYGGVVYIAKDENGGEVILAGGNNGYVGWDARSAFAPVYSEIVTLSAGENKTIVVGCPNRAGTIVGIELIDIEGDLSGDDVTVEARINGADTGSALLDTTINSSKRNNASGVTLPDTNHVFVAESTIGFYISVGASATGSLKFRINLRVVEN